MWFLLHACGAPAEPTVTKHYVVTAARDLHVGVPIGEMDVYGLAIEPQYVQPGTFQNVADVIGRVPSTRILANEQIRSARLADADLQRAMEAMVPPGLQVVTLPLDPTVVQVPVAGRDTVDVWLDADRLAGRGRVVVSEVPFLRIDGPIVALMATAPQVATIDAARAEGPLTVVPTKPVGMNFQE